MNKRLLGAAAVVILAVGMYLGNLFRGFGLGGGAGDGEAEHSGGEPQANLTEPSTGAVPAPDAVLDTRSVLTVLVDADRYQFQDGSDADARFQPAELSDVVARSRDAAGDEHGVRVRLRFRRNAQSGAINDLYQALQSEAGVKREEIIEAAGYVD